MLFGIEVSAKGDQIKIVFASEMPDIQSSSGQYAKLGTLLHSTRSAHPNTFFYFGGGSLGPSVLSSLDQGSHIIDLLNSLEPDAMGVSKREFSFYAANLSLRSYDATFPIVASNILEQATKLPLDGIVSSVISNHGSVSVGFLSIIDDSVIEDYTFKQIALIDPVEVIVKRALELRKQGADIIVLHYTGYYPFVYELLESNIIDVSLHKDESYKLSQYKGRLYHQRDVFIKRPEEVAVISLDLQSNGGIKQLQLSFTDITKLAADKPLAKQVSNYVNRLKTILNVDIGTFGIEISTKRDLVRTGENVFGNYVADSIKDFSGADLALVNSGFIRGDREYRAGEKITRGIIAQELPYRNQVVLIELTGKQLFTALENAFSTLSLNKGRFPQISGFKVIYDSRAPKGLRVKTIQIGGRDISLDKKYRLATTDYLAAGGDGYDVFRQANHILGNQLSIRLVSDIVMDRIMDDKIISPMLEGRFTDIKSAN